MSFNLDRLIGLPPPKKLMAACLSELVGTAFLVWVGCLSLLKGFTLLQAAIAWGTTVSSVVACFGHISGGHFNPSVTTAAMVFGSVSVALGFMYMLFQFLGGFLGFGLLLCVVSKQKYNESSIYFKGKDYGMCSTFPETGVTDIQVFLLEFIGTSLLIYIVCSVHDDRTAACRDSFALKAAGLIVCVVIAIGPLTGASLNLARSLPPAVYNNVYDAFWAYVLGPISAGFFTPILYILVFKEPSKEGIDQAAIDAVVNVLKKVPKSTTEQQ